MNYTRDQSMRSPAIPESSGTTKTGSQSAPDSEGNSSTGVAARAKRFIKKQLNGDERQTEDSPGCKAEGEEDELEEGDEQKSKKQDGAQIDLDEANERVEGVKAGGDFHTTAGLAGDGGAVKEDFGKKI